MARKASIRTAGAAAGAALLIGLFGAGSASAAVSSHRSEATQVRHAIGRDHGHFHALVGTVETIGNGSFTVSRGKVNTVTVDVSGSTTYFEHDTTGANFASLAIGDRVAIAGTYSGNPGTVDALKVAILPFRHVEITGTVAAIGNGSFTVSRGKVNTVIVDVSSSTTYFEHGTSGASFASLAVGDRVNVKGTLTATKGTVQALRVNIVPFPHVEFTGTISTIGTNSFTVSRGKVNTVTVDVSSSTTYFEHDVTGASFASLAVGDRVNIWGTLASTPGVVDAVRVRILPLPHVEFTGTISTIGTNSFTLTRGGTNSVTVDVSSSTTYTEHDVTGVTFGSLAVGDRVAIGGTLTTTAGTVDALRVAIVPFPRIAFTGTVSSVGSGSFRVTHGAGSVIVDVSSSTSYSEQGSSSASFGSLATGEHVAVAATETATKGTVNALSVTIFA